MIGERLKRARLKLGLTQKGLALEIGVTPSAISQYESEERSPSIEVYIKMLDVLHLSFDDLSGRSVGVTSDNTPYAIYMAPEDIRIINEIKRYSNLYKRLALDTERQVEYWNKKVG